MCGIVGSLGQVTHDDVARVEQALSILSHRGPDGSGIWTDIGRGVILGHRRLSIVDLSPAGAQPMHHGNGQLHVTFNGEIYNYQELRYELKSLGARFTGNSDTEVLLAAYAQWGIDCLSRLNGMFAFALHDARTNRVYLVRDRAGEKPLYYYHAQHRFHFASEIKALLDSGTIPSELDEEALNCYLAIGYPPGQATLIHKVFRVRPGHYLMYDLSTDEVVDHSYWQVPEFDPASVTDDAHQLSLLEELLTDSVKHQLHADVPVGVLLSGGVDSSLITATAAKLRDRIKTFTVRFPDAGSLDETEHARLIAKAFGTEHIELEADSCDVALLPMLAAQFDDPIIDSSMIPTYLLCREIRKHCTVALGGDGGDELFGGYKHYSRLLTLQQRLGPIPHGLRFWTKHYAENFMPVGQRGRNWLRAAGVDFRQDVPQIASYFLQKDRSRLLRPHLHAASSPEAIWLGDMPQHGDLLQRATRLDFASYLPGDILVKVDRASMLSSLEVRAPFLDRRLIEFAYRNVPSRLKATASQRKILLKKLSEKLLPPQFDRTRKQGFSIPINNWLRQGPWRQAFMEILLDPSQSIFDHQCIGELIKGLDAGRDNGERLFGLAMFELWRRRYIR